MARPTVMTPDVCDVIYSRLAGGESVRSICRDESMPAASTVFLACVKDEGFRSGYVYAREAAGYAHGDEVKEVVEMLREGEVDPQAARAMMDGLKWSAERMAAKAYGPKVDHVSSDGSMSPKETSDAVLAALRAKHGPDTD